MAIEDFEQVLKTIEPIAKEKETHMRDAIAIKERLLVTIRGEKVLGRKVFWALEYSGQGKKKAHMKLTMMDYNNYDIKKCSGRDEWERTILHLRETKSPRWLALREIKFAFHVFAAQSLDIKLELSSMMRAKCGASQTLRLHMQRTARAEEPLSPADSPTKPTDGRMPRYDHASYRPFTEKMSTFESPV
ncbi:hypothetical protein PR048_024477 [Dryococelus australis]|uniref:Uncharacterized protein n=1 Tax=Dryococelus australis TaxID=614101 RepID=A0ABQ9GNT0_9NEOP|nr:hypothetical protein PR048_024477 [Dryococelus australis]